MQTKIKPSDLEKEAQRMINAGEMPPIDKLLDAVNRAREKYGQQIKQVQPSIEAGANGLSK